jgi:hypothetical protein
VLNGEVGTTKNTSITLNENDKFKVKAIGDNERYLDSKYSIEITCAKIKASENLVFELSADESYYILTGKGSCLDTTIVIPDNYNGLPVKTIGEAVFADYSRLVTLIIPHTITSIEKDAFNNCSGLVDLVIPRNLTYIGENAFNENNNLTNIYFNGTMKNWLKLEFENETLNPMYYAKNLYMLDTKGDVVKTDDGWNCNGECVLHATYQVADGSRRNRHMGGATPLKEYMLEDTEYTFELTMVPYSYLE